MGLAATIKLCLRGFAALAVSSSPALAWGPEGHEIIAHIAARELTPLARARIAALLGGKAEAMMVVDANWADEIRDAQPQTAQWHFVDIPLGSNGFLRSRDCPRGDCVVAQIDKDARNLADRKSPPARRAKALKFLIHFVGDVHQPLHCIDNHDRGGNTVAVRLGRRRTNLHHLWDTLLVEGMGEDAAAVAAGIEARLTPVEETALRSGTPVDWANESFRAAKRGIYGRRADPQGLVRRQLAAGGLRLGWMLNRLLR
jgi:hypothetical protein